MNSNVIRWEKNIMEIVEFYTCDNKNHWLKEIKRSNWGAGSSSV